MLTFINLQYQENFNRSAVDVNAQKIIVYKKHIGGTRKHIQSKHLPLWFGWRFFSRVSTGFKS